MKYFKNPELCKLYNVSDKAVRNWIEAARLELNHLELYEKEGRFFILDTLRNSQILEDLSKRAKKYRNTRTHRVTLPLPEFYNLYDFKQTTDIALNLESFREFPHQYRYSGQGGTYWNEYLHKLYNIGQRNTLTDTIELLRLNWDYIKNMINDYSSVEVIDIGVGNGLAIKDFLTNIKATGKLKRYAAIDTSQTLLDTTTTNVRRWCGSELIIEKFVRDITHELISDIAYKNQHSETLRLFLFLGGTITNFRHPTQALRTIHDSMLRDDILITSLKLDSHRSRRSFDFHNENDRHSILPLQDTQALQLLGINETCYEPEQFYDKKRRSRFIQIKLKIGLSIEFRTEDITKVVEFEKGDRILLWRIAHYTPQEISESYNQVGFDNILCATSLDREFLILISRIKLVTQSNPYEEDSVRF